MNRSHHGLNVIRGQPIGFITGKKQIGDRIGAGYQPANQRPMHIKIKLNFPGLIAAGRRKADMGRFAGQVQIGQTQLSYLFRQKGGVAGQCSEGFFQNFY